MSLDLRVSKNILQIGEPKVSKSKFMHTLFESKSIFAIEQKAIICQKCCVFIGTPGILSEAKTFFDKNCER